MNTIMRRTGLVLCVLVVVLVSACSKKNESEDKGQYAVRGKVTYKGEPVPYGMVLFVDLKKPFDLKTKEVIPVGYSAIDERGGYEVHKLPPGPMLVFVATDPDSDPFTSVAGMPPGLPGMPPGPPGLPGGPPGFPGGPPGKDGPKPPPLPKDKEIHKDGPPRLNPKTAKLSAEAKTVLREIHAKYGPKEKPRLNYMVQDRDQSYNLELK